MRYSKSFDPSLVRDLLARLPEAFNESDSSAIFPWSDLQASANAATLLHSFETARKELAANRSEAPRCGSGPSSQPAAMPAQALRPGTETRISMLVRIPPERAFHPDHVVARAAFRSIFAAWPDGAVSYRGSPRLCRPPGTAGLAIASADFLLQAPVPADFPDGSAIWDSSVESPWFFVRWNSQLLAPSLLAALRRNGIKYQSMRQEAFLWHVLDRRQRAKTGIAALREGPGSFAAVCNSSPILPDGWPTHGLPPGIVRAVLEKLPAPCRNCGGNAFRALANDGSENVWACFDCLAPPRPKTKK